MMEHIEDVVGSIPCHPVKFMTRTHRDCVSKRDCKGVRSIRHVFFVFLQYNNALRFEDRNR
jgi:hypothetical protein